jgi:hypothetical protein
MFVKYHRVELYLMPYYEDGGLHDKWYTDDLDVVAENLGNFFGREA